MPRKAKQSQAHYTAKAGFKIHQKYQITVRLEEGEFRERYVNCRFLTLVKGALCRCFH